MAGSKKLPPAGGEAIKTTQIPHSGLGTLLPNPPYNQQTLQTQQAQQMFNMMVGAAPPPCGQQNAKTNEFVEWAERVRMNRYRKPVFIAGKVLFFVGIALAFIGVVGIIAIANLKVENAVLIPRVKVLGVGVLLFILSRILAVVANEDDFWTRPRWMD